MPHQRNSGAGPAVGGSRNRQAILNDFGVIALRRNPHDYLLDRACDAVLAGIDVDHVKVLEYRAKSDDLLVRAGRGWNEGVVGRTTLPVDLSSPPGRAFQTGRSVQINDITKEPSVRYSDLLREHGIVTLMNVPIHTEDLRYGVLEVDGTKPKAWNAEDVFFLEGVAHLIAVALQRHFADAQQQTLYWELQHRLQNTLTTVLALVEGQRRTAQADETKTSLTQLSRPVHTISQAHLLLSGQMGSTVLSVRLYLVDLCASLQAAIPADRSITIVTEIAASPRGSRTSSRWG
jgi:GAF domain-containing protein